MQVKFLVCYALLFYPVNTVVLKMMQISPRRTTLFPVILSFLLILQLCNTHYAFSKENDTTPQIIEQLIQNRSCRGCDLAGLNLNRLDLSGVDIEGADLSYAKLHLTDLSGANLKNTNLTGASFGGADLGGADLRGAELQGTSLESAYLAEALLDKAPTSSPPQKTALLATNPPADTPASATEPIVVAEEISSDGWWSGLPKSKKMLYTNLTAVTAIGIWGLATWDYGSAGLTKADEGWFEQDSKYGGADKVGHLWSTYAFSDALTGLYKNWGYDSKKANTYAALSAWTVQALMELGDATSETQGLSYEDMVMNTMGALTSVLMERYPELDRKIDLRVEYVLNVAVNGIFDDYSNQYYSLVLKLDGFDAIENTFARYIEFSGGYYTRGYEDIDEDDTRSLFVGIGFNFSRLLNQQGWDKTGKVFEYLQVPYTVPKASYHLD